MSGWDTIKHWCSYPSENVDRRACLPTVCICQLPHLWAACIKTGFDMMWLFICRLRSHIGIDYVLSFHSLSVCIHPVFLSFSKPIAYNLSSVEIVPLSLAIIVKHIFVICRIKGFSVKRLPIIQWPWLYSARLLMSPQQTGFFFFFPFLCKLSCDPAKALQIKDILSLLIIYLWQLAEKHD